MYKQSKQKHVDKLANEMTRFILKMGNIKYEKFNAFYPNQRYMELLLQVF